MPEQEIKRFYVFVHPVFAYFAEPTKTGKSRKGRQAYKALLGRKLKEIAKDKQGAVIWVSPWKIMNVTFAEWFNRQRLRRKGVSLKGFQDYIRPYQRLKEFAEKGMGSRFVSVMENLITGHTTLRGKLHFAGLKPAEDAEFLVLGERRQRCVNYALEDLELLYKKKFKLKVLENLCVKGGDLQKSQNYLNSYQRYFEEKMKARRAKARKKRRQAKKARKKK